MYSRAQRAPRRAIPPGAILPAARPPAGRTHYVSLVPIRHLVSRIPYPMQYPTHFLHRIAAGSALLALGGTLAISPPAASQFQPDISPRLVSAGAAPSTESWGE